MRFYFLSESSSQARFAHLTSLFDFPITEVYLFFYQSVLPIFNHSNLFLQMEDPCIHLVHDNCERLLRKVLGKFVKKEVIAAANCLSEVNTDISNQRADENIFVGFATRQTLQKLE